ncbi:MAG TPA: hypothetical protein VHY31_08310 [Streptosporangiaceae bacterium]|nr:hypothetical protein [Streptosporangiaceae bacterium]
MNIKSGFPANEPPGPGRRRRMGLLAAALAAGTLLAACGGGSPSAAPGPGKGPITSQELDAFAKCMRDHGLPNFYFVSTSSSAGTALVNKNDSIKILQWVAPADSSSPQFQSAMKACRHLLPLPHFSQAQVQAQLRSLDQQAACMRAHGYPDYPDPVAQSGGIFSPPLPADIPTDSPQYQSAVRAC